MKYRLVSKIFLLIFTTSFIEAKVTIFAHYFGQPEFVWYQYAFFKKNMLDDYEFVVLEDANDAAVSNSVECECKKYHIPYIHIPRSIFEHPKLLIKDWWVGHSSPSFECSVAVQYIYDNYVIPSKDVCVILDNDMFLISPFSIEQYLGSAAFAYVPNQRGIGPNCVYYMLPNFLILNPSKMPEKECLNFNLGTINGHNTDSGGYTYFYLINYKHLGRQISTYYLHNTHSQLKEKFANDCPLLFNSAGWSAHYFIEPEILFHMRMGSNWSKNPNYKSMINEITFFFDRLLMNTKSKLKR